MAEKKSAEKDSAEKDSVEKGSVEKGSVLWVHAHPDDASLGHALVRSGVARLRESGTHVAISDLYAMNWNPVLSGADFGAAPGRTLSERQKNATATGLLTDDIRHEQDALRAADHLVVSFPLWWYGTPAILKGWFDRVFTNGFAFGVRDEHGRVRRYGDGGLAGRTMLAVVTAGDRAAALGRAESVGRSITCCGRSCTARASTPECGYSDRISSRAPTDSTRRTSCARSIVCTIVSTACRRNPESRTGRCVEESTTANTCWSTTSARASTDPTSTPRQRPVGAGE